MRRGEPDSRGLGAASCPAPPPSPGSQHPWFEPEGARVEAGSEDPDGGNAGAWPKQKAASRR